MTEPSEHDLNADRRAALQWILDAVDAGLPAPLYVSLFEHRRIELRVDNNRADQVDAWAARLGVESVREEHVYDRTTPGPWQVVRARGQADELANWRAIEVWSAVDATDVSSDPIDSLT